MWGPAIGFCIVAIGIGVIAAYMFSEKGMTNQASRLAKMQKRMLEKNKETYKEIAKIQSEIENDILEDNQEILKETANKKADINKEAVKAMASAVKEGFSEDEMYCKHCGASIDSDSKFCKKCGKEQ